MKIEYMAWPDKQGRVTVDKVDANTGTILKTRRFDRVKSWAWWFAHGFRKGKGTWISS